MMTERGIEANPNQVISIVDMPATKTKKEVQRLTGHLAALNRYISRYSDKCKHFFEALKSKEVWTKECEEAFGKIKSYLTSPPVMVSPKLGEPIGVYLATSDFAVSAVLFVCDKEEKPVYFISKTMNPA